MVRGRAIVAMLTALGACVSGCSTTQIAQFEAKVGAKLCAKDHGITADNPQFEQCVAAYSAGYAQERADTRALMLGALGVGAAVAAAKQQGQAQGALISPSVAETSSWRPAKPSEAPTSSWRSTNSSNVTTSASPSRSQPYQFGMRPCPDGTKVTGDRCYIAPDGTYHGAPPRIAPNGTYVGGNPIICPDGSYVGGTRCELTPDGRYVGR